MANKIYNSLSTFTNALKQNDIDAFGSLTGAYLTERVNKDFSGKTSDQKEAIRDAMEIGRTKYSIQSTLGEIDGILSNQGYLTKYAYDEKSNEIVIIPIPSERRAEYSGKSFDDLKGDAIARISLDTKGMLTYQGMKGSNNLVARYLDGQVAMYTQAEKQALAIRNGLTSKRANKALANRELNQVKRLVSWTKKSASNSMSVVGQYKPIDQDAMNARFGSASGMSRLSKRNQIELDSALSDILKSNYADIVRNRQAGISRNESLKRYQDLAYEMILYAGTMQHKSSEDIVKQLESDPRYKSVTKSAAWRGDGFGKKDLQNLITTFNRIGVEPGTSGENSASHYMTSLHPNTDYSMAFFDQDSARKRDQGANYLAAANAEAKRAKTHKQRSFSLTEIKQGIPDELASRTYGIVDIDSAAINEAYLQLREEAKAIGKEKEFLKKYGYNTNGIGLDGIMYRDTIESSLKGVDRRSTKISEKDIQERIKDLVAKGQTYVRRSDVIEQIAHEFFQKEAINGLYNGFVDTEDGAVFNYDVTKQMQSGNKLVARNGYRAAATKGFGAIIDRALRNMGYDNKQIKQIDFLRKAEGIGAKNIGPLMDETFSYLADLYDNADNQQKKSFEQILNSSIFAPYITKYMEDAQGNLIQTGSDEWNKLSTSQQRKLKFHSFVNDFSQFNPDLIGTDADKATAIYKMFPMLNQLGKVLGIKGNLFETTEDNVLDADGNPTGVVKQGFKKTNQWMGRVAINQINQRDAKEHDEVLSMDYRARRAMRRTVSMVASSIQDGEEADNNALDSMLDYLDSATAVDKDQAKLWQDRKKEVASNREKTFETLSDNFDLDALQKSGKAITVGFGDQYSIDLNKYVDADAALAEHRVDSGGYDRNAYEQTSFAAIDKAKKLNPNATVYFDPRYSSLNKEDYIWERYRDNIVGGRYIALNGLNAEESNDGSSVTVNESILKATNKLIHAALELENDSTANNEERFKNAASDYAITAHNDVETKDGTTWQSGNKRRVARSTLDKSEAINYDEYIRLMGLTSKTSQDEAMLKILSSSVIGNADDLRNKLQRREGEDKQRYLDRLAAQYRYLYQGVDNTDAIEQNIQNTLKKGGYKSQQSMIVKIIDALTIGSDEFNRRAEALGQNITGAAEIIGRFPFSNGQDMQFANTFIDNGATGVVSGHSRVGLGLWQSINGDNDGDKVARWAALMDSKVLESDNPDEIFAAFKKVAKANERIDQIVAKAIYSDWATESGKEGEITEDDIKKLANRDAQRTAAIAARLNKQKTGMFSNQYQAVAEAMYGLGQDENGVGRDFGSQMNASNAVIARAFFESLTQDAISSKKVIDRIVASQTLANGTSTESELDKLIGGTSKFWGELDTLVGDLYKQETYNDLPTLMKRVQEMGIIGEGNKSAFSTRINAKVLGLISSYSNSSDILQKIFGEGVTDIFDENGQLRHLTSENVINALQAVNNATDRGIGGFMQAKRINVPGQNTASYNPAKTLGKDINALSSNYAELKGTLGDVANAQGDEAKTEQAKIGIANKEANAIGNLTQGYRDLAGTLKDVTKFNENMQRGFANSKAVTSFLGSIKYPYGKVGMEWSGLEAQIDSWKQQNPDAPISDLGIEESKLNAYKNAFLATNRGTVAHAIAETLNKAKLLGVDEENRKDFETLHQWISNNATKDAKAKELFELITANDSSTHEFGYDVVAKSFKERLEMLYSPEEAQKLFAETTERGNKLSDLTQAIAENLTTGTRKYLSENPSSDSSNNKLIAAEQDISYATDAYHGLHGRADAIIAQDAIMKDSNGNDVMGRRVIVTDYKNTTGEMTAKEAAQPMIYAAALQQIHDQLVYGDLHGQFSSAQAFNEYTQTTGVFHGMQVTDDLFKELNNELVQFSAAIVKINDKNKIIVNKTDDINIHRQRDQKILKSLAENSFGVDDEINGQIFGMYRTSTALNESGTLKAQEQIDKATEKLKGQGTPQAHKQIKAKFQRKLKDYQKTYRKVYEGQQLSQDGLVELTSEEQILQAKAEADLEKQEKVLLGDEFSDIANRVDLVNTAKTEIKEEADTDILIREQKELHNLLISNLKLSEELLGLEHKYNTGNAKQRAAIEPLIGAKQNELDDNQARIEAFSTAPNHQDDERYKDMVRRENEFYTEGYRKVQLKQQARSGGYQTFLDKVLGNAGSIFSLTSQFGLFASMLRKIPQYFQKVIQLTKQLDAAIVNLRIVTGGSRDQAERYMDTYMKLGNQLGVTAQAVTQAATAWLRQGYSLQESQKLVTASIQLSKLGMMDANTATASLTAALKGFKLEAQQASDVVDKLVSLDLHYATSSGDIANALSRVAAVAQNANLELDKTAAILTVLMDVTQQEPGSVGTALQTILSRYGNVKAGAFSEMSEEGEDSAKALNDIEKVLTPIGIKIRKSADEMKDFDDVMNELSAKWLDLSDVERNAISSAFAGTRQRNYFNSLVTSWEEVKDAEEIAMNSDGAAQFKYNSYLESVQASIERISLAWEKLTKKLEANGAIKGVADLFGIIVDNLDMIVKVLSTPILNKMTNSLLQVGGTSTLGSRFMRDAAHTFVSPMSKAGAALIHKADDKALGLDGGDEQGALDPQSKNNVQTIANDVHAMAAKQGAGSGKASGSNASKTKGTGKTGQVKNSDVSWGKIIGTIAVASAAKGVISAITQEGDSKYKAIAGGTSAAISGLAMASNLIPTVGPIIAPLLQMAEPFITKAIVDGIKAADPEMQRKEESERAQTLLQVVQSIRDELTELTDLTRTRTEELTADDWKKWNASVDTLRESFIVADKDGKTDTKESANLSAKYLEDFKEAYKTVTGDTSNNDVNVNAILDSIENRTQGFETLFKNFNAAEALLNANKLGESDTYNRYMQLKEAKSGEYSADEISALFNQLANSDRKILEATVESALKSTGWELKDGIELEYSEFDDLVKEFGEAYKDITKIDPFANEKQTKLTPTLQNMLVKMVNENPVLHQLLAGHGNVALGRVDSMTRTSSIDKAMETFARYLGLSTEELKALKDELWWVTENSLSNGVNGLVESFKSLTSSLTEFAKTGRMSSETLSKLMKEYPHMFIDESGNFAQENVIGNVVNALSDSNGITDVLAQMQMAGAAEDKNVMLAFKEVLKVRGNQFGLEDEEWNRLLSSQSTDLSSVMDILYDRWDKFGGIITDITGELVPDINLVDQLYTILTDYQSHLYDEQIEDLKSIESALRDSNKARQNELDLIKARQALENAQNQKKRVYREGIGFTYEVDQNAVKEAQDKVKELEAKRDADSVKYQIDSLEQQKRILTDMPKNEELTNLAETAKNIYNAMGGVSERITNALKEKIEGQTGDITEIIDEKLKDYIPVKADETTKKNIDNFLEKKEAATEALNAAKSADVGTSDWQNKWEIYDQAATDQDNAFATMQEDQNYKGFLERNSSDKYNEDNLYKFQHYDKMSDVTDNDLIEYALQKNRDTTTTENPKVEVSNSSAVSPLDWKGTSTQALVGDLYRVDIENGNLSKSKQAINNAFNPSNVWVVNGHNYTNPFLNNPRFNDIYDISNLEDGLYSYTHGGYGHKENYVFVKNHKIVGETHLPKTWQGWISTAYEQLSTGVDANVSGNLSYEGGRTYVNEQGLEGIITPQGTLTSLPARTGIVPADLTRNLYQLGEIAPNLIRRFDDRDRYKRESLCTTEDNSMNISNLNAEFTVTEDFDFDQFVHRVRQVVDTTKNSR